MIKVKKFEFCVAFTRADLAQYGEDFILADMFECFKDTFDDMSCDDHTLALDAIDNPNIRKQSAIAQQMSSGELDFVIVPVRHPSANLEFWTLDWGKK